MLLTNLAEPEWVSIDCREQIIGDILCVTNSNVNLNINITFEADLIVFENLCILINGKCYSFQSYVLGSKTLVITKSTLIAMENLVKAIDGQFPPFQFFFNLASFCRLTNKWRFKETLDSQKGLHVLLLSGFSYTNDGNTFNCGQNIFIAITFLCNGKQDCPGNMAFDEMACICEDIVGSSHKCKYVVSKNGTKTCSLYYLMLKDGMCLLYPLVSVKLNLMKTYQELNSTNSGKQPYIIHNRDNWNFGLWKSDSNLICQNKGQLSCNKRQNYCFDLSDICVYRLNKNNVLIPCKSGEHIINCSNIQCNMKFKCPGYYCIPWSYVCDGKWDCPGGYDEAKEKRCGTNRYCKNMFKCTNSQKCIHVGDVCDSFKDCPAEEDKHMCSLIGSTCIPPCTCLGLEILCYNVNSELYLTSFLPYNALFLSFCNLVFLEHLLKLIKQPVLLSLKYNKLRSVCHNLPILSKTLVLNLGFNQIIHVSRKCFKNGFQIITVKLNNNLISIFKRAVLFQLLNLEYLDLSDNFITNIFCDSHGIVSNIKIVVIKNNTLSTICESSFHDFNLKIVVTDYYFICCKTPLSSMCTSEKVWYESCNHILLQRSLTVSAVLFLIVLILSNLISIVLLKVSNTKSQQNSGSF